jgi:hypothetical protein
LLRILKWFLREVTHNGNINYFRKIYRLDKFVVPTQGREEFLAKVIKTHELLKQQPGFIQDFLLEQPAASREFNFVTLACIIHDDLRNSSKALLRNESGDLPKKQSVFWSAVAVRVSQVGE